MRAITRSDADAYLRRYGVSDPKKIQEVIRGFDLNKPMYEQFLSIGERLYQYIRNPSRFDAGPSSGNWFALVGATTSGLAIIDGISGRRLHKFEVIAPLYALEGVAARMSIDWLWAGGGEGGGTQIYVPPNLLGHLQPVGAQDRW